MVEVGWRRIKAVIVASQLRSKVSDSDRKAGAGKEVKESDGWCHQEFAIPSGLVGKISLTPRWIEEKRKWRARWNQLL
jgi:hypothetical protein